MIVQKTSKPITAGDFIRLRDAIMDIIVNAVDINAYIDAVAASTNQQLPKPTTQFMESYINDTKNVLAGASYEELFSMFKSYVSFVPQEYVSILEKYRELNEVITTEVPDEEDATEVDGVEEDVPPMFPEEAPQTPEETDVVADVTEGVAPTTQSTDGNTEKVTRINSKKKKK